MVLIIDEDVLMVEVIRSRLETDGYAVLSSSSQEEALDLVRDTKLTAVLLDLNLHPKNGFEMLMDIRDLKSALPVFMMTREHNESEAKKAFDLGAWDYITKPIDFNYLKNSLASQSPQ
jgi:DNA-binding response OmpR family regulator